MTARAGHGVATTSEPAMVALRRSAAVRLAASVLVAGAITAIAIIGLWGPLDIETDLVGYPVYGDFNPYNYFHAYYLTVGLFPIAALLIFLGLTRIGPRLGLATPPSRGPMRPGSPPTEAEAALDEEPGLADGSPVARRAVSVGRVAFVGAVVGLEVGIASDRLWLSLPVLATYGLAVTAASLELERLGRWRSSHPVQRLAAANALGASLSIAGLVLVSAHTEVRLFGGSVQHYPWFPVWLGLPIAAATSAWTVVSLRGASATQAPAIERRAVLLIAAPVVLFLLTAYVPRDSGPIDLFEEGQGFAGGQGLIGAHLVLGEGWFPWRDIVLTHGLLLDGLWPGLGFAVFGDSYWGHWAGSNFLAYPIEVVATYFLLAYLVGRNWTVLVASTLLFVGGSWLSGADPRFVLWPLILLVLATLLRRPSPLRAAALASLVLGQAILVPEALPSVVAVALVVVAYEWYWRDPGTALVAAFRRSIWYAASGLGLALAAAIYFASRGALDDVLYVTINLIRGHILEGALPPNPGGIAHFDVIALLPVGVLLASFAYAAACLRLRRPFLMADWVMAANALFLAFYYPKFLARMDGHVYEPYSIALPLALYIVYRAVTAVERWVRERSAGQPVMWITAHPVGLALVVVALVGFWGTLRSQVTGAPGAYRPVAKQTPQFSRVGYAARFDGAAYEDLRRIIDAYLAPRARLEDLTNEPALFYYFMKHTPSTRWYAPNSIADRAELQSDILDRLRQDPPKLVVFDDSDMKMRALPNMDGVPATVRLYLVSRWVLDHYRPLVESHGRTIYARPGVPPLSTLHLRLHEQPATAGVPFRNQECSWGYAPTFLQGPAEPPAGARGTVARLTEARPGRIKVAGWAGDTAAGVPAQKVIVTVGGRIVGRATPHLARPDLRAGGYPAGFGRSGFKLSVPASSATTDRLRAFAVGPNGSVVEIPTPTGPTPRPTVRLGNRTLHLSPSSVTGAIDSITPIGPLLRFQLPARSSWTDYRWLELDAPRSGFRQGGFAISDLPRPVPPETPPAPFTDSGRQISFNTLPRSPHRYIVPVSSCAQWHGYPSHGLFLTSSPAQRIARVRLIR